MIAFKIEINPVKIKEFNNKGQVTERVSHYIGFIHGISNLNLKNLYIEHNRRTMIDKMFATLNFTV